MRRAIGHECLGAFSLQRIELVLEPRPLKERGLTGWRARRQLGEVVQ